MINKILIFLSYNNHSRYVLSYIEYIFLYIPYYFNKNYLGLSHWRIYPFPKTNIFSLFSKVEKCLPIVSTVL